MDGYRADGYYYDWLERQWVLPVPRKLTLRQKRVRDRRKLLLRDLVVEIENGSLEPGSGLIRLYATLAAKALLAANPELMNQWGRVVVGLAEQDEAVK